MPGILGVCLLVGLAHAEVAIPADIGTRFAAESSSSEAIPKEWTAITLPASETATAIDKIYKVYHQGALAKGEDKKIAALPPTLEEIKAMPTTERPESTPSELVADGKTMPYFLVVKGHKPAHGWPLVIALHGGGGTAATLAHPHAWQVNTREWQAQLAFFETIYPGDAMYFIPRMADDNDGRWYYDYCQKMYDQIIRRAILFRDVDPNRIYVTGISEGGYTAYRLPANRPDRFAAACAMAAAEPMDNAPPENLRNLAFRCAIGEKDSMFDRIGLARRYFARLDELEKEFPGDYIHQLDAQAGRGHGIDYAQGPRWMVGHTRNPRPKAITWTLQKLHHSLDLRNNWLALDEAPATFPSRIDATISANTITLHGDPGLKVRLFLDDQLVNLDQPVRVVLNDREVFNAKAPRNIGTIVRTLESRGDPTLVYPAEISW